MSFCHDSFGHIAHSYNTNRDYSHTINVICACYVDIDSLSRYISIYGCMCTFISLAQKNIIKYLFDFKDVRVWSDTVWLIIIFCCCCCCLYHSKNNELFRLDFIAFWISWCRVLWPFTAALFRLLNVIFDANLRFDSFFLHQIWLKSN